jgi:hypothetical protein
MGKGYLKGSTEFLFYAASILVKRAMNSLVYRIRARFSKSAHEIDGLANIEHAMNSLGAYLAENNRRFESLQGVHVDKN